VRAEPTPGTAPHGVAPSARNATLWRRLVASLSRPFAHDEEEARAHRRLSSLSPTSAEALAWRRQRRVLEKEQRHLLALETPLTISARDTHRHQLGTSRPSSVVTPSALKLARLAHTKPRLGVCVIGQISRLELASKLRHFLEPLGAIYKLDVVLALGAQRKAHFVNKHTDVGGRKDWSEDEIRHRITSALRARNGNSSSSAGSVVIDTTEQEATPLLHYSYVMAGDKYDQLAQKEERVRSHVRQWRALWLCYGHFVRLEIANGEPYAGLVKLREDSLLLKPIAALRKPHFFRGVAVFKNCNAFEGLNDKVAVMDASYGYAFFAAPLLDWYFNFSKLEHSAVHLKNPESYLLAVMKAHRVKLRRVEADVLPAVTSRAQNNRATATCIPLQRPKIGWGAHCLPQDCEIRKRVFCHRCPDDDSSGWSEAERRRVVLHGCVPPHMLHSWSCKRLGANKRIRHRRHS
jgi:hypothetical protein